MKNGRFHVRHVPLSGYPVWREEEKILNWDVTFIAKDKNYQCHDLRGDDRRSSSSEATCTSWRLSCDFCALNGVWRFDSPLRRRRIEKALKSVSRQFSDAAVAGLEARLQFGSKRWATIIIIPSVPTLGLFVCSCTTIFKPINYSVLSALPKSSKLDKIR